MGCKFFHPRFSRRGRGTWSENPIHWAVHPSPYNRLTDDGVDPRGSVTSMHDPATHPESVVTRLRRRLDRALVAAWAVRLLGWLGHVAAIDLAAVVVASVVAVASGAAALPLMRGVAVAATLPAAIVSWWLWAGDRPTRLAVARAAEAACPALGERLSRAVEWLDTVADPAQSSCLSGGLRRLAIEDAAAAAPGRLPTPGLAGHGPWIVAGGVAVALLLAAIREPRPPVRRLPAEAPAASAAALPELIDAGERLERAASIEQRLGVILAERFAAGPGVAAFSLAADAQNDLASLAAIQRETIEDIRAVRDRLSAVDQPAARAATALLQPAGDVAFGDDVAEAIADNRLARAAAGAVRLAGVLAESAAILGRLRSAAPAGMPALESRAVAEARRVEAMLDRVEARIRSGPGPAAGSPTMATTASGQPVRQPEGRPTRPVGPGASADAGSGAAGTSATTTEPRFAAGAAEAARSEEGRATVRTRVWSLLPAGSRPSAVRGSEADAPPEYRDAVDLYYELLLESLASERKAAQHP